MNRCHLLLSLAIVGLLFWPSQSVLAQGVPLSTSDRYTVVLPSDPFKWEHVLNELGQKGWEAVMAMQPSVSNLTLHLVICVRPTAAKPIAYKVVVANFSSKSDSTLIEATRLQLEVQGNSYSQNGWQMVQALTGLHGTDSAFLALIFKKPQP